MQKSENRYTKLEEENQLFTHLIQLTRRVDTIAIESKLKLSILKMKKALNYNSVPSFLHTDINA